MGWDRLARIAHQMWVKLARRSSKCRGINVLEGNRRFNFGLGKSKNPWSHQWTKSVLSTSVTFAT